MKRNNKKHDVEINSHKIKTRIFELGLSQEYIANKMGLNYSTLNLKLNNKRPITLKEIVDLANVLELTDISTFITYFGLDCLNLSSSPENATNIITKGA